MRYLFFVNPAAGKGVVQKRLLSQIEEFFAEKVREYKIYVTRFAGDAEQIARKEAQTGDELRVFACGGEGTCYEVLNGIYGFENVELGVIPCGSANDFLKQFVRTEPFSDLSAQIDGNSERIDIIRAGERYCINSCSVGMDAMVARDMKMFKKIPLVSGKLAYKLAIVKNFLKPKIGVSIDLKVDDEEIGNTNCLFAVIANAPFYGGGYMAAPRAISNDGVLDFTCVKTVWRFRILKFLSHYQKGTFDKFNYCRQKVCKSMSFKSEKQMPINLDGEVTETTGMNFEIVPRALKFIIPKGISLQKESKSEKLLKNV